MKQVKEICIPLLVLLVLVLFPEIARAAQLNMNELLKGSQFINRLEYPIIRPKRPRKESKEELPEESDAAGEEEEEEPMQRKIALTFDDGPDPQNTAKILNILKTEKVPATFFVLGERVARYPALVKRIFDEGHLLANHSHTHTDLTKLSNEEIVELELEPTSQAVEGVTGFYPTIMRPPYGSLRLDSVNFLRENGWQIVRWSLDTFDWDSTRNSPEEIYQRVVDHHHPSAIVLMHCNGPETVEALPDVINVLRELNYEFVIVTEI